MKKTFYHILMLVILPLTVNISYAVSQPALPGKITLGIGQPEDATVSILLNKIYTEAFSRLGITFEFRYFPAKRCSYMSDMGITDGEGWRIYNYNEKHPILLRVETPNIMSGFVAYAQKGNTVRKLNLKGWKSLKMLGENLIINSRRGQKKTMDLLTELGFVQGKNWELVNTPESGVLKLLASSKRTDLYIDVDWVVEKVLSDMNETDIEEVIVLEEVETYMFLNIKYKKLVPEISSVLKDMHDEGLIAEWSRQAKKKQ